MDFLSKTHRDSVSNPLVMNNGSSSPDPAGCLFGFHGAGNSQVLDSSLQLHQRKRKKPADNERSHEETQGFMKGAQEVQRRGVSAPMSSDFNFAEATSVTTTELQSPPAATVGNLGSLSANGGGAAAAKAGKKRSRASRRAPTTLLNTDTSNFRAMVQRFTGIPETPFGYSSMNPSFTPGHQDWQLLGKPLPYKAVLDLNMNCVSHLSSAPDSYRPQQYNSTTFLPFQSLHDYINISTPLNLVPKAPQGQNSNSTLLNDVGLMNSAPVFPSPAITLSSDRRPAYLL